MKNFILLLCFYSTAFSLVAQSYFPPTDSDDWDTTSPSSLGYCQDNIDSLYQFLEESSTKAFILIKDGRIVLEQYFNDHTASENWYWASAGKSLTAALVGIAQQEGDLDIDNLSSQYLGEGWTNCTPEQESMITVKNQLSMTSGLDDGVPESGCTDPECLIYKSDAGTRWAYHNGPYTILDEVIESATGETLNAYVRKKINIPIGMNGAYLPIGENNVFFSTPRSMARFGLLILNKGIWNGNPILSDSDYFEAMTTPSQNINKSYGYLWWLNGQDTYMLPQTQFVFSGSLIPNAPSDMISALGKDGQIINVIPSENMVWIRMGESPDNLLVPAGLNNDIWAYINQLNCNTVSTTEEVGNQKEAISIYPNPTKDLLNVRIDNLELGNKAYLIYDLSGAIVYRGKVLDDSFQIPTDNLPQGIYSIAINNELVRFVKE